MNVKFPYTVNVAFLVSELNKKQFSHITSSKMNP